MGKLALLACTILAALPALSHAQQSYRVPDVSTMKHVTTKASDRDPGIPGKETTMDYYSAPNGQIITVYTYRGRKVAWSVHSNRDSQTTFRVFLDSTGNGLFQEIRGIRWQLPPWAK